MHINRYLIITLGLIMILSANLACGLGMAATKNEPAEAVTGPAEKSSPIAGQKIASSIATTGVEQTTPTKGTSAGGTPNAGVASSMKNYDTVFPLPEDVQNFTGGGGENQINFQTSMSMEEVIKFYREDFTRQGLSEYEILTSIEKDTFSMVFKGSKNGKGLVIQGVKFGTMTNVNIRFEDI